MKRLVFLLMIAAAFSPCFAQLSGSGTGADPYLITSLSDFDEFTSDSTYWAQNVHTTLSCDLDLAGRTSFTAIIAADTDNSNQAVFDGTVYNGVFDGGFHRILNLNISTNSAKNDFIGLFGKIGPNGKVENLDLKAVKIIAGDAGANATYFIGSLCGYNTGQILNCDVTGNITVLYSGYVGGLAGQNDGGVISECFVGITLYAGNYSGFVGGLAGVNVGSATGTYIENCHSRGSITGGYYCSYLGGLTGTNIVMTAGDTSTIINSRANCNIIGSDNSNYLGGLTATNENLGAAILNCYATGNVNGKTESPSDGIGGLCGLNYNGALIKDCYSKGNLSGSGNIGGLCGVNSDSGILNCFTIGTITVTGGTANTTNGAFCGFQQGDSAVMSDCFWNTDMYPTFLGCSYTPYTLSSTEPGVVSNVTCKRTFQMHDMDTFMSSGWDFVGEDNNGTDNAWRTPYSEGYPILSWEHDISGDIAGSYGVNLTDFSVLAMQWLSADSFTDWNGYSQQQLLSPDGEQIDGASIAVDNNLAVGSDSDELVYVFNTATGEYIRELVASDSVTGDKFGNSVDISGNTIIVGAYKDDDNGTDSGSAYLFDATTGQQTAKLTASDGADGDWFGYSVAVDGNTAVVGAYKDDDNGNDSGSVYLFNTLTGQQIAKLTASDGAEGAWFGGSVDIDGDMAIIGALGDDAAGNNAGAAYLFDIITQAQLHKLTASDATEGDYLGMVAIDGTAAIAGSYYGSAESVYVFDATTGSQLNKITPSDAQVNDHFGCSVDIDGDRVIIGAYANRGSGHRSGAAYLFDISDGSRTVKLMHSLPSEVFGYTVALNGRNAVVGTPLTLLAPVSYDSDIYQDSDVDFSDLSIMVQNWFEGIEPQSEPPATNDFIAYWQMDEGSGSLITDSSGNDHYGTLYGPTWTTGKFGSGLFFDGMNDYVDIPYSSDFAYTIGEDPITISAWVYPSNKDVEDYGAIYSDRAVGNDIVAVSMKISSGKFNVGGWSPTSPGYSVEATVPSNNQWYLMTVVFDLSQVELYIDGDLKSSASLAGVSLTNGGTGMILGKNQGGSWSNYYSGKIDDVRIYNKALSDSEILLLMNP